MKDYTTETGKYVLLDTNGEVIAKADVPPGTHPVPDVADLGRVFDVDSTTDLSTKLADSPANLPANPPNDPATTAFEKLENVVIDDTYRP